MEKSQPAPAPSQGEQLYTQLLTQQKELSARYREARRAHKQADAEAGKLKVVADNLQVEHQTLATYLKALGDRLGINPPEEEIPF